MSTEARRASIPPRPATPPHPTTPPRPGRPPTPGEVPALAELPTPEELPSPSPGDAPTPEELPSPGEALLPPRPKTPPSADATRSRPTSPPSADIRPPRQADLPSGDAPLSSPGRMASGSGDAPSISPRPKRSSAGDTPPSSPRPVTVPSGNASSAPPRPAEPPSAGEGPGSPSSRLGELPAEGDSLRPSGTAMGAMPGAGRVPRVPSPSSSFDFFDFSGDTSPTSVEVTDVRRTPRAAAPSSGVAARREEESRRFPELRPERRSTAVPPPPAASARFPDAPPAPAESGRPGVPRRTAVPEESPTETTRRLRPIPAEEPAEPPVAPPPVPAPPPGTPAPERPFVSFAQPETYDDGERPRPVGGRRPRPRIAAAAACVVLGLGLIGGAVTGSWLTGDSADGAGSRGAFAAAGQLWHSVPVDQLFPPAVQGDGAGPGGADRAWTRVAVAPDSGCKDAFDPLLRKALAPVGCLRLLRATYTDATRSHVTTVGLLFTKADAAAMSSLKARFQKEGLNRRTDLMPRAYAVKGTVADGFGDAQRASWTVSVLTDAPVVVYAVSGFADGRTVTAPQPAADAMKAGATTATAQAGLGHEAQGLADRVERGFRKTVTSATEKPS